MVLCCHRIHGPVNKGGIWRQSARCARQTRLRTGRGLPLYLESACNNGLQEMAVVRHSVTHHEKPKLSVVSRDCKISNMKCAAPHMGRCQMQ